MKTLLTILSCFLLSVTFSQNEGNIWYFGYNAGIDFNSGTAVALSDGAMQTGEGCASICDNNGNLLFYTDGSTVYNANHQIMPNGTGLMGNGSSSQSAIIVKKPLSTDTYYIVTADALENGGANGIRYSEVDMSLQGGLGDVTVLNVLMLTPSSEKITAISHQNGIDYWIVTISPDLTTFNSFLLTNSGLNALPVISTSLSFLNGGSGYLKANPIGDKIATHTTDGVQVFDFDNSSGLASNGFVINPSSNYGLEFSPNSQYLYMTKSDSNIFYLPVQYDLQAGSIASIVASEIMISIDSQAVFGAFQLGPDNKIYMPGPQGTLSTIENPNLSGLNAGFQSASFQLNSGTTSTIGLPNFYNQAVTILDFELSLCFGDSVVLSNPFFQNFNWALASSPGTVFSNETSITVSPNNSISYVLFDGGDSVFFNITVFPSISVDLGPDVNFCGQNSVILTDANNAGDTSLNFLWQDGSINDSLTAFTTGQYILTVSNDVCEDFDTIVVSNVTGVDINANNPICNSTPTGSIIANVSNNPNPVTFVITDINGTIYNTTGTNAANNLLAGDYIVTYSDGTGCVGTEAVQLVDPLLLQPTISITNPLCFGDAGGSASVVNIINYQGDFNLINYIWTPNPQNNNGLLADSIWGLVAGEYNLEIIDDFGCVNSQIFNIVDPNPLEATITDNIPTFCRTAGFQSGNGVLAAEVPGPTSGTPPINFNWVSLADGQTANTSTVVMRSPGQVVLTITDNNNCTYTDTVQLDSLNPIADFIIESNQFDFPEIYEGTEDLTINVTNLSQNFAQAINPNSDTIFQWNLYTNGPNGGDWFFTYNIDDKVDTTYQGEEIYQVCLIAKNYNDCADTLCKDVIVHDVPALITPNVFTPGSSPNSHFFFPAEGIQDFECTVFNRYGVKVYEFNDIADQWDGNHFKSGNLCSDGVYFYVYKAESFNGKKFNGEGQVTLVRND